MDNDERLARIQARARAARRSYWRGWALRQGAFKREAERIAAALERQLQEGRAPTMADQWVALRWYAQGVA